MPTVSNESRLSALEAGSSLAPIIVLPKPSGGDDAAALNALIASAPSGAKIVAQSGAVTYNLNTNSLILYPFLDYDFADATFTSAQGLGKPLVVNKAQTVVATVSDVSTTGATYAVWTVTAGTATGGSGTWSFVWNGITYTTPSIAFNASAAAVAAAIQAAVGAHDEILPGVCVGTTGGPLGTANVVVTFQGNVTGDVSSLAVATNSYTGGTIPTFVHTTTGVAGSNVITSPQLVARGATIGQTVSVVAAGPSPNPPPLVGTITAIASNNITLADPLYGNATPAYQTLTNASASLYTRDAEIRVRGGKYVRSDTGGSANNLNTILLRHCDRVEFSSINLQATAGKYAISIGDATLFTLERIRLNHLASDGIHLEGACYGGVLRDIKGVTGDDFVSLTARDYTQYEDVSGNIIDIKITDCHTTGKGLAILAGQGCTVSHVTVDGIHGSLISGYYALRMVDDTNFPQTQGGVYDDIVVRDARPAMPNGNAPMFQLSASGIRHLTFDGVFFDSTAAGIGAIFNQPNSTSSIEQLVIRNLRVRSMTTNADVLFLAGMIVKLHFESARLIPAHNIVTLSNAAAYIKRLYFSDVSLDGAGGGSLVQASTSGATLTTVHIANMRQSSMSWLVDLNTTTIIYGSSYQGNGFTSGLVNVRAAGNVRLVGQFDTQQTPYNLTVAGGGFVSVNAHGLYVNASQINAAKTGDTLYNTNSATTAVGPVMWTAGATWQPIDTQKNGTATLAAGTTGSIANTSITANSIVRVWNVSAGGTVGALSVVLAAGTGFTINSTSGTDTSKVYWEIAQY